MPAQKVRVGDIDIAYKQLGNGSNTPIVLIAGGGMTMDMWNPTLLKELSSNQTVIIFDNRGAGESTIGTEEYSITQLANDTAGLLDALKIGKADILGYSMGSFIAQELALMNPAWLTVLYSMHQAAVAKKRFLQVLRSNKRLRILPILHLRYKRRRSYLCSFRLIG